MTQTLQAEHLTPDQLSAFVDAELTAAEMASAELHLAECHRCTLHVLELTRLKAATMKAAQNFTAPPDALARLAEQLRPQQSFKKKVRVYSFPAMRWVALAACLLVAVSVVAWWQIRHANMESAELLDQHLAVLSSAATPEVISTDRHTVKPWFQGKLPFSFNLPQALPPDTVLKGADLTYLDGHPAAMLLFTIHKHDVSVFLTQRSSRFTAIEQSGTHSGFAIHYAHTPELRIAAVSNVDPKELDLLIADIVQAQQPQ